jgi:hypothetical protein
MSDPIDLAQYLATDEISDEELQELIRQVIWDGTRADIRERAVDWFDKVSDLLFVLRAEMPELLRYLNLGPPNRGEDAPTPVAQKQASLNLERGAG